MVSKCVQIILLVDVIMLTEAGSQQKVHARYAVISSPYHWSVDRIRQQEKEKQKNRSVNVHTQLPEYSPRKTTRQWESRESIQEANGLERQRVRMYE